LELDDGAMVRLKQGDCVVQNGTRHAWRNSSTTPCIMAFVLVGASFAAPPLHASDFNRLAYNPEVTYLPPILDTGLPMTGSGTDSNGNYGTTSALWNSASVARDPFFSYEPAGKKMWSADPKDDLGLKVTVSLYCNTDWPALVNDVYWPGGPNGATVLDAGDSNGQYSAGTGGWCRINGTKYTGAGSQYQKTSPPHDSSAALARVESVARRRHSAMPATT